MHTHKKPKIFGFMKLIRNRDFSNSWMCQKSVQQLSPKSICSIFYFRKKFIVTSKIIERTTNIEVEYSKFFINLFKKKSN